METPRIRINAKQNSKGEWYFNVTAEIPEEDPQKAEKLCLETIKAIEKKFKLTPYLDCLPIPDPQRSV